MAATLLHFHDSLDTSGYFAHLGKWHDLTRYRVLFGTLRRSEPTLLASLENRGIPSFSLDSASRLDYSRALPRLVGILRRERVAILHTHLFEPSVVGLVAGAIARTPVRVLTRHYSDYHTRIDKRWHVRLDRLCTRLAHAVIAVSRHTADHMITREGAPRHKLHVVLNGVDFERLGLPRAGTTQALRRELGAENAKLILMVARLHPEKGHSYLFRALPGLRRRFEGRLVLAVAGTGPFEAAYRKELDDLGCQDVVRFLSFRRDVGDLIRAADLVVLPSLAEAFGLAAVEALHLGAAVVATRVGGIPEIIDDGQDGLLVPPADVSALARAIAAVLDDEEVAARLRTAGPAKAARFRFEDMVRGYESVYEGLLGRRGV